MKVVKGEIVVDLVDIIAETIYGVAVNDPVPFCIQKKSCKAFYRRIARWHAKEIVRHIRMDRKARS